MTRKKTTTKEEKETKPAYNVTESLATFPKAEMIKAGFLYKKKKKKIQINSDSKLETELNKYLNQNAGA